MWGEAKKNVQILTLTKEGVKPVKPQRMGIVL
jgi:hypothetical protein